MQPPARIRFVLLSDRRIFKQGLFIMKTVRGTLPRLVFCGKFNIQIKVFACLLGKAAQSRARSSCRAPQSAKLPRLGDADTHASHMCQSPLGVFFLVAFSFAPVYAKEKADREPSPAGEGGPR